LLLRILKDLGKPITKETADEHLLKTMKRFSVSLDDIIALGKHLPSGEDELNEAKTKKLKLKVKRNRWLKSKAELPKSEQKSEVSSTPSILTGAI
jgi:Tfp pilus assembly PilM family ATPase